MMDGKEDLNFILKKQFWTVLTVKLVAMKQWIKISGCEMSCFFRDSLLFTVYEHFVASLFWVIKTVWVILYTFLSHKTDNILKNEYCTFLMICFEFYKGLAWKINHDDVIKKQASHS